MVKQLKPYVSMSSSKAPRNKRQLLIVYIQASKNNVGHLLNKEYLFTFTYCLLFNLAVQKTKPFCYDFEKIKQCIALQYSRYLEFMKIYRKLVETFHVVSECNTFISVDVWYSIGPIGAAVLTVGYFQCCFWRQLDRLRLTTINRDRT